MPAKSDLAAIEHQNGTFEGQGAEPQTVRRLEHLDPDGVAGKAGAAKRAAIETIASGRRGANCLRTARQARPKVLRPCEIGRSNPASRAISGSAWIGM